MKSELKLSFGKEKIYYGVMYNRYIRHDLPQGSYTLFMNLADKDNKQNRNFHRHYGVTNIYCRGCETLMVVPNAINLAIGEKGFKCPSCGHFHKIDNIAISEKDDSLMPKYMVLNLYDLKDSVELQIRYDGIKLGNYIYNDFREVDKVKEQFIFDTKAKQATWKKTVNGECVEELPIGYYSDLRDFDEKSAMYWLNSNFKSLEDKGFCDMLKILRDKVNEKMTEQGYGKRKMYMNGTAQYKAVDNLLAIAHQVRFWDCQLPKVYGGGKAKLSDWTGNFKINLEIEKVIESEIRNGESYTNAMIKAYNLPNEKFVRKNINIETAYILSQAYSIKGEAHILYENFRNWISEELNNKNRQSYHYINFNAYGRIKEVVQFYNVFQEYYPQTSTQKMIDFAISTNGNDTMYLWRSADKQTKKEFKENIPKFKELHDTLSLLVAKQADRELDFDIPDHIVRRMEMHLQNVNCEVLQKFSQVKQASLDLKNCASGYRNRINEQLQLVLVSDDKGKPIALLEINDMKIVQAKLYCNKPVHNDEIINAEVIKFAEKANLVIATKDIETIQKEEREFKIA